MAGAPVDRIRALWAKLPEEDRRILLKELTGDPDGEASRKRGTRDGLWKRGDVWWIRYTVNGTRRSESADAGQRKLIQGGHRKVIHPR